MSPLAILKNNWHFLDAQRFAPTYHHLEHDFESNCRFRKAQQTIAPNREKTAHGIAHAGERISETGGGSRNHSPPDRPTRSRAAVNVATADDEIGFIHQDRPQ